MSSQSYLDDAQALRDTIAVGWAEDDCQGYKIVSIKPETLHDLDSERVNFKLLALYISSILESLTFFGPGC